MPLFLLSLVLGISALLLGAAFLFGVSLYFIAIPLAMIGFALTLARGIRRRFALLALFVNALGLAVGLLAFAANARANRKIDEALSSDKLSEQFQDLVHKTFEETRHPPKRSAE